MSSRRWYTHYVVNTTYEDTALPVGCYIVTTSTVSVTVCYTFQYYYWRYHGYIWQQVTLIIVYKNSTAMPATTARRIGDIRYIRRPRYYTTCWFCRAKKWRERCCLYECDAAIYWNTLMEALAIAATGQARHWWLIMVIFTTESIVVWYCLLFCLPPNRQHDIGCDICRIVTMHKNIGINGCLRIGDGESAEWLLVLLVEWHRRCYCSYHVTRWLV